MQHPVDELMNEHRLIEAVLSAMEDRLADPAMAPETSSFFEQALDFLVNFADGCHHSKEEDALFPALSARGVSIQGGPIGVMLHEHEMGRARIRGMRDALTAIRTGQREAFGDLRRNALEYIQILREHIWKEDNVLFRIAKVALDDAEAEVVLARFHDESNPKVTTETLRRYRDLADALCAARRAA